MARVSKRSINQRVPMFSLEYESFKSASLYEPL